MPTKQERFEQLQARWRAAKEKADEFGYQLRYKYGEPAYLNAPRVPREKYDRLRNAEDRASDAIFKWLDAHSPRSWRTGVPSNWVCESLTYADAMTRDRLSVVPPCAYGSYPEDMVRFSSPVVSEVAPSW